MDRDLRGRAAGLLLFGVFLIMHLYRLAQDWQALTFTAKINGLLLAATIILFLSAYFLRKRPVEHAQGVMETLYPLFVASLPLVIYHGMEVLRFLPAQSGYYTAMDYVFGLRMGEFTGWNMYSIPLVIGGNLITFIGIVSLRKSFSIMAEAREPVFSGIYRHVRHPLYLGEIIATAGVLLFRFSLFNVMLTTLFIVLQVFRSRIEEKKLLSAFPEYDGYRRKVGAFFPKFRR